MSGVLARFASKASNAVGVSFAVAPIAARCFSTGTTSGTEDTKQGASSSQHHSNQIVVFGGRGFVGSHIIQEALDQGLHVVSISRSGMDIPLQEAETDCRMLLQQARSYVQVPIASGTPPAKPEPWMEQVQWVRGNALEPQTYSHLLEGSLAAISAVGAFGTQEQMMQLNGTANITAIKTAAAAGVPRFVYISALIPNIPGIEMLLRGYVQGKRQTEEALREHFPMTGVAIRPGVIYGNRVLSTSTSLPLQYLFQPVEQLLKRVPSKQLSQLPLLGAAMVPPVDVRLVAKTAVRAATDSSVPGGVIDVWDMQDKFK